MSMIGNYRRVTPDELSRLVDDPEMIYELLDQDEEDNYPRDRCLDIDKSWNAIHFLLTGEVGEGEPPFFYAVLGGAPVGDIDVGYGPARYLTPEHVSELATALESVPRTVLLSRFDLQKFRDEDIYPTTWKGSRDDLDYIGSNYDRFVEFVAQAAQSGDAMLLFLN